MSERGGHSTRRKARAYALQVLYALDLNPLGPPGPPDKTDESAEADASDAAAVERAIAAYAEMSEVALDAESRGFAESLVARAVGKAAEIDELIQAASKNWRIDRMARVDRSILRLAAAELEGSPDVPVKVVLNEAVELAKRFGTAESPAFVNGILDRIAHQVRGGAA